MDCTNESYTLEPVFIEACKLADTSPTRRQASRFRMGKGRAYKVHHIIARAPRTPAPWFQPNMGQDTKPAELLNGTPEEIAARNVEIAEWKTRYHNRAAEQWPKAWALKTAGL